MAGAANIVELTTTVRHGYAPWWLGARRRHVVASREGLWVDAAWFGRPILRCGYVCRQGSKLFVRLETDLAYHDIVVPSSPVAKRMLAALRLDGKSAAFEASLMLPSKIPLPVAVLVLVPLLYTEGWYLREREYLFFLSLLAVLAGGLLLQATRTVTLTIGSDGLSLRDRRSRCTFVPYSMIDGVRVESACVVIERAKTSPLRLSAILERVRADNLARARSLARRIEEESAAAHPEVERVPALERGGRTLPQWLAALRRLGSSDSYRTPHIEREIVWKLLENPRARPVDRVAAAIAWTEAASPDERERLEGVLERCANADVRDTLRACSAARSDDTLLTALANVES